MQPELEFPVVQYIRNLIPKVAQEAEASRLTNLVCGRSTLGRKLGGFLLLALSGHDLCAAHVCF